MPRSPALFRLMLVLPLAVSCAGFARPRATTQATAAPAAAEVADEKLALGLVTSAERADSLARAQVWVPTDPAKMDLLNGPAGKHARRFDDRAFACDYMPRRYGGSTPKFACRIDDGTELKIKFVPHSGEVPSEILGTRLLWALGFLADRQYPADVTCRGCPESPGYGGPPVAGQRRYEVATYERRYEGAAIEDAEDSGWSYAELATIDPRRGGAPRAHVDALRLLTVFTQHFDAKADNQRLVCRTGALERDAAGKVNCREPFAMIHDLGETFGGAGDRADLASWRAVRIWEDAGACVATIAWGTGDEASRRFEISEAGRAFLADLLSRLSRAQVKDLFRAALLERKPGNEDLDAWADAFREKVDEIRKARCPR
jgi:hypothetical protein